MPFAMNSVPSGWLGADGTAVSRSTYAALFAAISTLYGAGDGSTTFNLPDLRGYFVRGAGSNGDTITSGSFGAKQADSVGPHIHPNTVMQGDLGLGSGGYRYDNYQDSGDREFKANFGSPANTGTTETRPVNIAMLYCIKI
jgi:phage-related tail fiber protein